MLNARQKQIVVLPPNVLSPEPLMQVRGNGSNIILRMRHLEGEEMRYALAINGVSGGYALNAYDFISGLVPIDAGTGDGSTTVFVVNANTLFAAQSVLGVPVPIMPSSFLVQTEVGAQTEYLRDDGGPNPTSGSLLSYPGDGKLYWSDGASSPVLAGYVNYFSGVVQMQWPVAPDDTETLHMNYRHTLVTFNKIGAVDHLSVGGEEYVRGFDVPSIINTKGRVFPLLQGEILTVNGCSAPSSSGKPTTTKVEVEVEFLN